MFSALRRSLRTERRKVQHVAVLSCPHCGERLREQMPDEGSVLHTKCFRCGLFIHKRPGSCCVYCSDADIPCPQEQRARGRED
jgi:hypothetical protein